MPRTKITTYDGLIRQIVSYFGSYKSDEKLRIITEWIMDNVHVDDLDTLYEYILRENTFSPGIREIQASYSEMAKRSQRASDKHVIQQKRDEQAARSDKTDWSKPIPESKAQLQVGDIFAICWTMCVRDEYLKALEMGKELSQDRIRDYESAGIKTYFYMLRTAIDDPQSTIRNAQMFFEKVLYPAFRKKYGIDRLTADHPLPRSNWLGIRWNMRHSIVPTERRV
jgi:uncharacterized protein YfkK (UPF0435 family)